MVRYDTKEPAPPLQTLQTTSGVTVIVHDRVPEPLPAWEEEPEPEPVLPPPEPFPRAIIMPANQPAEDREVFIRWIYAQHGAFILDTLTHRWHVRPESAKDLRQSVILILLDHYDRDEHPQNVRGFLQGVIRNEVRNHGKQRRPNLLPEGDADAEISPATNPESAAARAEHREKIQRYLAYLPEEEAEAVQLVDLMELSVDAAAEALGRPRGTVATQLVRARKALRDLALASERATTLGARR